MVINLLQRQIEMTSIEKDEEDKDKESFYPHLNW